MMTLFQMYGPAGVAFAIVFAAMVGCTLLYSGKVTAWTRPLAPQDIPGLLRRLKKKRFVCCFLVCVSLAFAVWFGTAAFDAPFIRGERLVIDTHTNKRRCVFFRRFDWHVASLYILITTTSGIVAFSNLRVYGKTSMQIALIETA